MKKNMYHAWQTVLQCRFIIKLSFLLLFCLQVLKNFAEETDLAMNSDHARESHHAVTSSVCLYSNR